MKLNIVEFATGREHQSFCPAINYNDRWVFYPETHPNLVAVIGSHPVPNQPIAGMHYKDSFRPTGSHWKNFLGRSGFISGYFELNFKDEAFDKYRMTLVESTKKKANAIFSNRTQVIKSGIHAAQITLNIGKHKNHVSGVLISMDGVTIIYFSAPVTKWKPTMLFLKKYPQTNTPISCDVGDLENIKTTKANVIIHDVYDYTDPEVIQNDILGNTAENIQTQMHDVVLEQKRKELPAFNSKILQLSESNDKGSE